MVFDLSQIIPTKDYTKKSDITSDHKTRVLYYKGEKVFLVENENTLELRSDQKLSHLLTEKYETVMESRYFGRGGIEIVLAGQLSEQDISDLIRLSYYLTN